MLIVMSAVAGGVVAAVAGFGIGSLLTPVLAWQLDVRLAVAAVSIPHLVGTLFRFFLIGGQLDRRVLWSFGIMSAAGGATGALLQEAAGAAALMIVFGSLLLFTAGAELSGLARRIRFEGPLAWMAGAGSGFLGGLVGNQGGIRSAALLGVHLPKHAFVATATAIALMVDLARVPVYVWHLSEPLTRISAWLALASAGVIAGTLLGNRALDRLPEWRFRQTVAFVLAFLGSTMLIRGIVE